MDVGAIVRVATGADPSVEGLDTRQDDARPSRHIHGVRTPTIGSRAAKGTNMDRELVVVANDRSARLFERTGDDEALRELERIEATPGAEHRRHALPWPGICWPFRDSAGKDERSRFAERVALAIERQVGSGQGDVLDLFVPEPFLTHLLGHLSHARGIRLRGAVELDLTAFDRCELEYRVDLALHLMPQAPGLGPARSLAAPAAQTETA